MGSQAALPGPGEFFRGPQVQQGAPVVMHLPTDRLHHRPILIAIRFFHLCNYPTAGQSLDCVGKNLFEVNSRRFAEEIEMMFRRGGFVVDGDVGGGAALFTR